MLRLLLLELASTSPELESLVSQINGAVGAILLVVGAVQCYLGFKIFKIWFALAGFLLGVIGGGVTGGVLLESMGAGIVIGFIAGIILAYTAVKIYFFGVFVLGAGAGFILGVLLSRNTALALILAVVIGILAVKFARIMIIVTTSVSGGFTAAGGFCGLIGEKSLEAVILSTAFFVITGIIVQYVTNRPPAKPGKSSYPVNDVQQYNNGASRISNHSEPIISESQEMQASREQHQDRHRPAAEGLKGNVKQSSPIPKLVKHIRNHIGTEGRKERPKLANLKIKNKKVIVTAACLAAVALIICFSVLSIRTYIYNKEAVSRYGGCQVLEPDQKFFYISVHQKDLLGSQKQYIIRVDKDKSDYTASTDGSGKKFVSSIKGGYQRMYEIEGACNGNNKVINDGEYFYYIDDNGQSIVRGRDGKPDRVVAFNNSVDDFYFKDGRILVSFINTGYDVAVNNAEYIVGTIGIVDFDQKQQDKVLSEISMRFDPKNAGIIRVKPGLALDTALSAAYSAVRQQAQACTILRVTDEQIYYCVYSGFIETGAVNEKGIPINYHPFTSVWSCDKNGDNRRQLDFTVLDIDDKDNKVSLNEYFRGIRSRYRFSPEEGVIYQRLMNDEEKIIVMDADRAAQNNKVILDIPSLGEVVAAAKKDNVWGFINPAGKFVSDENIQEVRSFSEGLAPVKTGGKWGYINAEGAFQILPEYDQAMLFSEGLAAVKKDGKWYYIDKEGKVAIETQLRASLPPGYFKDGIAPVIKNDIHNLHSYIDKSGAYILEGDDRFSGLHSEGLLIRYNDAWPDRKCAFVDRNGVAVTDYKFDDLLPYSEGLAAANVNGKWGFIDKKGEFAIQPVHDDAGSFFDGLAYVKTNGRCGFIDKSGRMVIPAASILSVDNFYPFDATDLRIFREGLACVQMEGGWAFIDAKGDVVLTDKGNIKFMGPFVRTR